MSNRIDEGSPGQRRTPVVVWVAIVAALLGSVALAVAAGLLAVRLIAANPPADHLSTQAPVASPETEDGPAPGEERKTVWAGWTGSGRYAVTETGPGGGLASAVTVDVWDSQSGNTQQLIGYHVLAAEETEARLWVVPADEGTNRPGGVLRALNDLPDDHKDSSHDGLAVWTVGSAKPVPVSGKAQWAPLAGAGKVTAVLTVDPVRGAWPSGLTFVSKSGSRVAASLPDAIPTFEPLGFSASGRYFAVRDTGGDLAPAIVIVYSTSTGRETTRINAEDEPYYDLVCWHPSRDVLVGYGFDYETGTEQPPYRGWLIAPENGSAVRMKWSLPEDAMKGERAIGFLDGNPVVLTDAGENDPCVAYVLSEAGYRRVETDIDEQGASLSPSGRVLLWDWDDGYYVEVADDLGGRSRVKVWPPQHLVLPGMGQ